jgi:hypothetical protein
LLWRIRFFFFSGNRESALPLPELALGEPLEAPLGASFDRLFEVPFEEPSKEPFPAPFEKLVDEFFSEDFLTLLEAPFEAPFWPGPRRPAFAPWAPLRRACFAMGV